ncbi:MAG: type II secretion system F family protein [Actinobacteria bacterium]|nr:type II secretion system F family protein [Actinomycetota bacterium]
MTGFVLTDSDRSLTQRLVTQHRDHTLVGLRGEIFQRVSEHDDVKGWVLVVGGGDQFECRCDVHLSDARVAARKGCATQFGDETVDCLSVTLVVVTQPLGDITSGSERTGLPEIRGLVGLLVQTLRFGTGIADTLRVYAAEFRDTRTQLAEERAAKIGTKLIFPLIFCEFPAFFAIAIGPAALRIVDIFQR